MPVSHLDRIDSEDYTRLHSVPYARDFRNYLRTGDAGTLLTVGNLREYRTMGLVEGSGGGVIASEGFSRDLWTRMNGCSAMRAACTTAPMLGTTSAFAYVDDTSALGQILPEGQAAAEASMTMSLRRVPSFMFSSDVLRVSFQLVMDAGLEQFESQLIAALARRVASNLNLHLTRGIGAAQPQGIVNGATVAVTTAAPGAVTWGELADLVASVDDMYTFAGDGQGNEGRFMLNGTTLGAIRKLTTSTGAPVWVGDPTGQTAGVILGHRCIVNPDMPSLGSTNRPVLFGNFKLAFAVTDGVTLVQRFSERYAERGEVGFQVVSRHGGEVVDLAAVKAIQCAA